MARDSPSVTLVQFTESTKVLDVDVEMQDVGVQTQGIEVQMQDSDDQTTMTINHNPHSHIAGPNGTGTTRARQALRIHIPQSKAAHSTAPDSTETPRPRKLKNKSTRSPEARRKKKERARARAEKRAKHLKHLSQPEKPFCTDKNGFLCPPMHTHINPNPQPIPRESRAEREERKKPFNAIKAALGDWRAAHAALRAQTRHWVVVKKGDWRLKSFALRPTAPVSVPVPELVVTTPEGETRYLVDPNVYRDEEPDSPDFCAQEDFHTLNGEVIRISVRKA